MKRQFKLSDKFIDTYKDREVPWGPVGYITFKRTYARKLNETIPGAKGTEEWYQMCRRVIEGMFDKQKEHINNLGLEWNDYKAQKTAKDAYERFFVMKWTPPGRGCWMMGSNFVRERTGAALFNCSFRSTKDIDKHGGYIFSWMMDALMLGIGAGFDTKGAGTLTIKEPMETNDIHVITDDREGWVESVKILLNGYYRGDAIPEFDYSIIRGDGEPIVFFGGTSSGPGPLIELHEDLKTLYSTKIGKLITSSDIVDTENFIGKAVVAGNIRRSAAVAIGEYTDSDYLLLKDPTVLHELERKLEECVNEDDKVKIQNEINNHPLRTHRWSSNNSIYADVGMDYTEPARSTELNGEPGYFWLNNARNYGRFKDGLKDDDNLVEGVNACAEQQLESGELCCLVETYPAQHDSYEDYTKTLKMAYLYAKTTTLFKTHWPETNAIMLKNRRIGLSQSGVQQAKHMLGFRVLTEWCDNGYGYLDELDKKYSDWFCIPRSKRKTSVKPSGTVSLLNGSTPGIHYPEDEYYIRRIRFSDKHDMLPDLINAGYHIEPCLYSGNTVAVSFPVKEDNFVKGKRDVSMWEQLEMAAAYQYYWADNSVSITVTFRDHEAKDISTALSMYESRLKSVSFLRYKDSGYKQAPYEGISREMYLEMSRDVIPISRSDTDVGGIGEKFCTNDTCTVPQK